MSLKLKDIVGDIFHTADKEKQADEQKNAQLQQKVNNVLGVNGNSQRRTINPYLNRKGELVNPYLNYQQILDSPNVSQKAKDYITQATGLVQQRANNLTKTAVGQTVTSSADGTSTVHPQKQSVQPKQTTKVTQTGNSIADSAQSYLGTPYVWGGESMEEGGMDCSGFVYNALKDAGYNVGRTTAQGYRSQGTVVSKSEMQPGDLIFFGSNPNDASHIGIYIGNGQMIHSAGGSKNTKNNPGKGVSIVNVDHRSDFLEARRY